MLTRTNRRVLVAGAAGLALPLRGRRASAASPRWRLLDDGGGPAARWDHALAAFDSAKTLLLFGGRDADGAALGDTWLFDLGRRSWRPLDGEGPSPRFGHAVAVDQERGRLLLFGGQSADTFFDDAWAFDFDKERWRRIDTSAGQTPAARYGLGGAIDGAGRLLISHGFTFEGRFDDTWALDADGGTWTELSPADGVRPLKRCLHEVLWDEETGRLLLYGGCSSGFGPCPQGDLWSFDPETRTWTELSSPVAPAARSNPSLAAAPQLRQALLLGGLTETGAVADLWILSLDGDIGWAPLDASGAAPSPRSSHDAVVTRGDLYLFGGRGDALYADLWKLSLT